MRAVKAVSLYCYIVSLIVKPMGDEDYIAIKG